MAEQEGAGQRWVTAWHGASRVICPQQNSYFLNFLYSLISSALCSCERDCEKKSLSGILLPQENAAVMG